MDRTKKYIRMSDKSPLKDLWNPSSGDFVYCKENSKIVVLYFNKHHGAPPVKYTNIETAVPLFRQDQLQEMIVSPTLNIAEISKWALEAIENADYYMQFDSWEQLWLGFVMKAKFRKFWNGKEWMKNANI